MSKRRRLIVGGPSDATPRPTPSRRQDGGPADGPSGHRPHPTDRPTASPRQDRGPSDGPSCHRPHPTDRPTASPRQDGGPADGGPSDNGSEAVMDERRRNLYKERRIDPADGTVQTLQEMIQKYWKYSYGHMAIETYFDQYCTALADPPYMPGFVPPGRNFVMERRRALRAAMCAGAKARPNR